MVYQYIACSPQGEVIKGRLTAANEEAVNDMMSYAGYRLINLKPYIPFLSVERLKQALFTIKPMEIVLFFRQLALLLESGVNIVTSLELLQEQMTNPNMKKAMQDILKDLRNGNQLSTAMAKHPEVFSPLACRTLSIGEQTGGLETMLRQVADYMEKEITARKSIKSALTYPIIAAVVTVIVVGVLVGFVLPAFGELYDKLHVELPTMTKMMMDFSETVKANIMYIIMGLVVAIGAFLIYIKTPDGSYKWDKFLLKLPLIGRVKQLNELSRCCRSISILFTAGLPLTEIMSLVTQGTNSKVMAQALNNVHQDMLKGEGLSTPMSKNPFFLPMIVRMVKVGEETGSLDTSLLAIADNYETEAEDKTKALIGLIQPIMTLVIAGVIGLIALSMVSAMYSVYGAAF
ncbi:MAG TPA: type II secretion system F family protein [Dehalococcoidia bacterium]|nr:type II secretion system F family protein [Dehalococcoidia bacterium]